MKKIVLSLLCSSICMVSNAYAGVEGERCLQSEEAVKTATYGRIDARGLKALIDSKTPFVLLDGRGNKWHDGNIIPGAHLVSYDQPVEVIEEHVPQLDTLVVVYCYSFTCPLGPRLAQKLVELGYENVLEYPAGLQEWRDVAHYPVESIQND